MDTMQNPLSVEFPVNNCSLELRLSKKKKIKKKIQLVFVALSEKKEWIM